MKIRIIALFALLSSVGLTQTVQQPLLVTRIAGIGPSWAGECAAGVVDNRSTVSRANLYHAISATGSGSWTASLSFSDTTCTGSFTSYGSTASVNQSSSPAIAFGVDTLNSPHKFIKITVTGNATATYTAVRNLFLSTAVGSVSFPISIAQGGTGTTIGPKLYIFPPRGASVGTIVSPDGATVSTVGTTSQGLQEAINYAVAHGFNFYIVGGQETTGCVPMAPGPTCGAVVYNSTAGVSIPPLQGVSMESDAFTLNCTSAVGSTACLTVDSLEMAHIYFPGTQIVNAGTGITIRFHPTTTVPNDPAFGKGVFAWVYITTAVNIHSPASDVAAVPLVDFDSTDGPITYTAFTFDEINASGIGLRVKDPPSGKTFSANKVTARYIHDQQGTNPMVQVGQTQAGGSRISINTWDVFAGLGGQNSTGKGISTFEQKGKWDLNVNNNHVSYALYFETGAAGNLVRAGELSGDVANYPIANTDFSYGGDCTKNSLTAISAVGPYMFNITVTASPFTYVNNTCRDLKVAVSGGTVSLIETATVAGVNEIPLTGMIGGVVPLRQGQSIRVSYSVLPTVKGII